MNQVPAGLVGVDASVRVMLCDDSPTVRRVFERLLGADPSIRVVARAGDGRAAVAAIEALPRAERPQVILLDLEMPVMDGMTALPLLLRQQPRPAVIVASALSQRGAAATMAALGAGASDYIPKPGAAGGGLHDPAFQAELLAKVKGWARLPQRATAPRAGLAAPAVPLAAAPAGPTPLPLAIGIGASTGGPQALAALVRELPRGPARALPAPVLIVQHMPAGFTTMLADHLDRLGGPPCVEVRDGQPLLAGRIYLAPGDWHLLARAVPGGGLVAELSNGPPENFCRPAVDPMLNSLAATCRGRVLAVILTGMGQDGLRGCRAVAEAGGTVLAQDEASSVVWGMPGAVARAGLARALQPPPALAAAILSACRIPAERAA